MKYSISHHHLKGIGNSFPHITSLAILPSRPHIFLKSFSQAHHTSLFLKHIPGMLQCTFTVYLYSPRSTKSSVQLCFKVMKLRKMGIDISMDSSCPALACCKPSLLLSFMIYSYHRFGHASGKLRHSHWRTPCFFEGHHIRSDIDPLRNNLVGLPFAKTVGEM